MYVLSMIIVSEASGSSNFELLYLFIYLFIYLFFISGSSDPKHSAYQV